MCYTTLTYLLTKSTRQSSRAGGSRFTLLEGRIKGSGMCIVNTAETLKQHTPCALLVLVVPSYPMPLYCPRGWRRERGEGERGGREGGREERERGEGRAAFTQQCTRACASCTTPLPAHQEVLVVLDVLSSQTHQQGQLSLVHP